MIIIVSITIGAAIVVVIVVILLISDWYNDCSRLYEGNGQEKVERTADQ